MPINQAAKRLVRAFRIAFRAARILATDSELPRLLRILFVIGCIQIPCLPTDEIAMALALGWLFLFHRDRLAHAVQVARAQSDTKEHTMSGRKLAVVSAAVAAVAAVLAVVVSLAVGAVPAFASSARSPLATAVVSVGRMVRMPASKGHDGYPAPDRAACIRNAPRPGHVPPALEIGATGLTWQYVTAGEARYFHVSRCSVVVVAVNRYGQDADLILTPSGRVTGRS